MSIEHIELYKKIGVGLVVWMVIICSAHAPVRAEDHPFKPGERLTYVLKWGVIPAGEGMLEVYPMAEVDGEPAYHFVMKAKSNAFVDVFYKVHDRMDAYADAAMQHSLFFKKKQREGGYKRDVEVNFDWEKNQALYERKDKDNDKEVIDLMPGSFDPLSAFYFTRMMEMVPGTDIAHPITDGRKNVVGVAHVVRRETIKVADRYYDTFLIVPDLKHIGGVFKESKDATIQVWVTADHRRIPVKLKSKVVVGSFVGELVNAEGLDMEYRTSNSE